MAQTLSNFDNVLKINYEGPIREQLTQEQVLLAHIVTDTTRTTFRGKQTLIPIHTGRNTGRGARAEQGTLPTAGNQSHQNAIYNMAYNYGRISITGQTIEASKDNAGSFARAVDVEMKGLARDLKRDFNRQLWHAGEGLLTHCSVTANKTTIQVLNTKFIEPGMIIDLRQVNDGSLAVANSFSLTVSTVPNATTFTVATTNMTTIANDGVYLAGSRDVTGATVNDWDTPHEMWGLDAIVNNANPAVNYWDGEAFQAKNGFTTTESIENRLGQLDAGDITAWQGNMIDASAEVWDDDLDQFQRAYDESEIEGESSPGLILTSHAMRRAYGKQLQPLRRYGDKVTLASGWSGLEFNNGVVIADRDASHAWNPANSNTLTGGGGSAESAYGFNAVYFIAPSSLEYHVLKELAWEDMGGILVRAGVGTLGVDEYEAFMKQYTNLICTRRNANTVLLGDPDTADV